MIEKTLSERTIIGSTWTFSSKLVQQLLSLSQLVILGRLLSPADFGLLNICILAIQALSVFVYAGHEIALVQHPNLQKDDIHTVWWITLVRQVVIGSVLISLSSLIATFYGASDVKPILIALAVIQCILGLANPIVALLQRELQFQKIFYYQVGSLSSGLIAGIVATLLLRNVWGLVIATVVSSFVQIILSYVLHPYRPGWQVSKNSLIYFMTFGKWMLGSAIVWFALSQGSNAFSGWMFGLTALGLYQTAGRFALLPSTQFTDVVISTFLPAFSIIQNDIARTSKAFLRTFSISIVFISSSTAVVALGLPYLFIVILGDKWRSAASLIPALAIAGGMRAVVRTGSPLFLGTGHPHYQFWLDAVQAGVMVILLYPLGQLFGLNGLSYATLIGSIAGLPIWWYGVKQTTQCTLWQIFQMLIPSFVGVMSIAVIFTVGSSHQLLNDNRLFLAFWYIVLITLSLVAFFSTILLLDKFFPSYLPIEEMKRITNSIKLHITPQFLR